MTLTLDSPPHEPVIARRSWKQAMLRGAVGRCPHCGRGKLFRAFLKPAETCSRCGEEFFHHRADDAPPYFTIFIVGHIVVPAVLVVEKLWAPPLAVHFVLWTAVTLTLTFLLMPMVKGAIIGLQWALRMHGFDYAARRSETDPLDR